MTPHVESSAAVARPVTRRALTMAAILATMFMVAIEATIIATAMPQIVGDLGGLKIYSWVFASFLLTQTAATVVFGKLADVYGRKPVILLGISVFLVGSVLCGFAWSMPTMIGFRLVQGLGAGAVQPVALTIVGDLFPARERGKVQGYLASVWAVSALLGPLTGGFIVRDFSWSWIFWMNVPIGLLAATGFVLFLHEDVRVERKPIDIAGALLFTLSTGAFMIMLTEVARADFRGAAIVGSIFLFGSIAFVLQERRAADPMLSFALWSARAIAATNGVAVLASMALMGLTSFLPMYVQGVLHRSPVVAGLTLTMMMVGWPAGAMVAARTFPAAGLRRLLIAGGALIPIGAIAFLLLTPRSSPVQAGLGSLVMGFGMGLVSVSSLVLIQEVVPWQRRASATASNMFSRNLGSALGATLLGTVLNFGIRHSDGSRSVTFEELERFFVTASHDGKQLVDAAATSTLQHALHLTFVAMLMLSAFIVILAVAVPDVQLKQDQDDK